MWRRRARFLCCSRLGGLLTGSSADPSYRWIWYGWRESMREESARHPVVLANLRPYILYYFISAPLVFLTLAFAPILEWRKTQAFSDAVACGWWRSAPTCCSFSTTARLLTGDTS